MSPRQGAEGRVFVVKNPVSGQFFGLGEAELFIARQLDGETPLEEVRRRAERKFGATLGAENLRGFVENLEKGALLEPDETAGSGRATPPKRVRGSLLYLRLKLFDPDPLFNRLLPRLRFLFTPQFLTLSAALVLLALGTTLANWGQIGRDLSRMYHLHAIPTALAVLFVVVSAHEFAHGLTCKRFGGEVHEIGFMLLYFQPAFYCNVSDAWLFPEKAKRLWVSFAGPYVELFLWALATLAWRLTDGDTRINYLALVVMTTSGLKTLLSLNPFIKLDGYYLLSDYLEVPNLRKTSFRYVGGLVRRALGLGSETVGEISRRQRRIYAAYGVVAAAVSFSLLAYIAVTVGGVLIESRQPMAFAFFSGLLGVVLRRRVGGLFGGAAEPSGPSPEDGDLGTGTSERAKPRKSRSRSKRKGRSWRQGIQWTAVTGATAGVLFFGRLELRVAGAADLLPQESADVRAAVDGVVEEIEVVEGDWVRAGDVIARLSNEELVASLRQADAQIRATRANMTKLVGGPTAAEVEMARIGVVKAQGQLAYARDRLSRLGDLFEERLLSRHQFEDVQQQVAVAEIDLAQAQGRLALLVSGSRPEDVEATRASIDQLVIRRAHLQSELRQLNVVSRASGIVGTPARQLREMAGQTVRKGSLIAKVYDSRTVRVEIPISEKEIADIRLGQEVVVKARAYPDVAFHGRVTSISTAAGGSAVADAPAPVAATSPGLEIGAGKTFLVTTVIDNRSLLLKPGMAGHAKISCGRRRIGDLLTRRLARTFKVEFWSWW